MQLLKQLTDEKVFTRLFAYLGKIVDDLKKPAKDNGGHWEVTFLDGLVFTVPEKKILPSLVFIEHDLTVSYLKPIKEILPLLNFSIDINDLEPLLEYLKKSQKPQTVNLYDTELQIILPNGNERSFQVNNTSIDKFNILVDDLEQKYQPTKITNLPVPYEYMDQSFSERTILNVVEFNVNLAEGTMTHSGYSPDQVNTRLLRKNIVGVTKTSKKTKDFSGAEVTTVTYSPLLVDFLDHKEDTEKGCLKLTTAGKYYRTEGYYYVLKV